MAENDSSQEKTEEATPRKKQKAREDGQIPRSKELTTTAILLGGTVGLWIFGGAICQRLLDILRFNFDLEREEIFDVNIMLSQLGASFSDALLSLMPLFGILALVAVLGPVCLGGWLFSGKSLLPKFSRIDPLAGMKRMFSAKSLVELAKAIGKVSVVIFVAYLTLLLFQHQLLHLSQESLEQSIAHSLEISIWAAIFISASTIVIVLIDIPFQFGITAKK